MKWWGIALLSVVGLGATTLVIERTEPFGARSAGDRQDRMENSPLFSDGEAQNLIPTPMGLNRNVWGAIKRYFRGGQEPDISLPVVTPSFPEPASHRLHATWLGHSSIVLEIDRIRLLIDPMLSERSSPFSAAGPQRFHPAPIAAESLPKIDAVVFSHDHYDHLDMETVKTLAGSGARFIAPLGVGAHLESWGISPALITELQWWEETTLNGVRIVCTPARHFSGRGATDRNQTLWAGWAVVGSTQRAWYSGDTGAFPQAAEIGDRLGPFDLTMIEIGAYDKAWKSVHLGPDGAYAMNQMVGGRTLFPIHWGTFNLAAHRWDQPVVRLMDVAKSGTVQLMIPAAGERQPADRPRVHDFWRERQRLWDTLGRDTLDE
jgi:L-ascorbate metabolism protein UlaG (beta-lactamase superfamily)